jgi:hypothetical protein
MTALWDVWHAVVTVVTGEPPYLLALGMALAIAAGFALDRLHSFVAVTLAALAGFGLAKIAQALAVQRSLPLDDVFAGLWRDFAATPMLIFTAYALIFAGLIGAVAAVRAIIRHAAR